MFKACTQINRITGSVSQILHTASFDADSEVTAMSAEQADRVLYRQLEAAQNTAVNIISNPLPVPVLDAKIV